MTGLPDILASERLAAHVAAVRFDCLPESAVVAAKVWILDTLGVGIAGSSAAGMEAVRAAAAGWGNGDEATIWGTSRRAPAPAAAFINGTQVHNQEFDCLHEGAVVHAMATLLPALLAMAERKGGVSGRDLIAAVVAGIDIAANLGLAATAGFRFFRPATAGGFGAVAGLATILGLDAERTADAFGLQYGQTSGTMQPHAEGNALLPMQVGFNAQSAIRAADLAAAGVSGPRDIFEGRYGYFPLFEGSWDLQPIWAGLGRDWRVCEMSHKPWPAGRATHGGIEGLLALREAHGFRASDVRRVRVIVPPLTHRLVARPDVPAPNAFYARLCMAFIGAKALLTGTVDIDHCRGEALTDKATHDLALRIVTEMNGNPDPNALAPQRVEVSLRSGETLRWTCETMLANPARPLTRGQHVQKFTRCLEFAQEPLAAIGLIDLVDRLEQVEDVRALCALLAPVTS
ncbi:MAG TPA: MmgE/PrpD family protein [Acetobacteraceae bacterium]|nr:MmgE/PrpD family protein [Acetobacteraceae bacterium]